MKIPIFITTRDRVTPLKQLLAYLEDEDVTLVDNASTYEPLLDFLNETEHKVIRLEDNLGQTAPWMCGAVPSGTPYIVTDPDVVPQNGCPKDFIQFLIEVKSQHPTLLKVGMGLDIYNLPDHYRFKQQVIQWESKYWQQGFGLHRNVPLFWAPLDTTFAVYSANSTHALTPSVRVGFPYVLRHIPWYVDSDNATEEDIYYKNHAHRGIATWLHDDISPSIKPFVGM